MYRFGYCSSENSIFYHDINLLNQYHVTLRKNVKRFYRIDESLVKLLYKKYLHLYQNRKIHRNTVDEKRTEYFNDFNECLVEQKNPDPANDDSFDQSTQRQAVVRRYSWQENYSTKTPPVFWFDVVAPPPAPPADISTENDSECSTDYDESFSVYHDLSNDTQKNIMNTDEIIKKKLPEVKGNVEKNTDDKSKKEQIEQICPNIKEKSSSFKEKPLIVSGPDAVIGDLNEISRSRMTVIRPGVDNVGNSWGAERKVILNRERGQSFGISIVGGKVNISGGSMVSGIFIKNIITQSPADADRQLKVGDRILAVDGIDIRDTTHEKAVQTIKNASNRLELLVQSLDKSDSNSNSIVNKNSNDSEKNKIKVTPPAPAAQTTNPQNNKAPPPPAAAAAPTKTPEPAQIDKPANVQNEKKTPVPPSPSPQLQIESDEEDDELRNLEGKTTTKGGKEIDRASAGNVKLGRDDRATETEEEDEYGYTAKKVKKRYGALGPVFLFKVERGDAIIGLSLAGHRDRTKMASFVAGLNPKGTAFNSGLKVGDELLEVNGLVVEGRCHLNVSCIIKNVLSTRLHIIVVRKPNIDDLAVKPVTQFPVEIEQDDVCANFKNVRAMQIAKGQQSLGIMIIEGKHAEVGQGIFVSDIQQDSNAEKAGLMVGDLIIFVNRDLLLGCSYDEAVNTLKKAEGMVNLKVCNPNLGKEGEAPVAVAAKAPEAKPVNTDPATCDIDPNKNMTIEINTDNKPIGLFVAGGKDTHVTTGVVVVDINPGGPAGTDKRLQVLDQILQINEIKFNAEMKGLQIHRIFKQCHPKSKLIVFRPDPAETETIEVDLVKKSGKMLGLGFRVGNPKGVVISDIITGGIAEAEKKIQKGDIITHTNSDSLSNISIEECAALLKSYQGKVTLKILRPKPKSRDLK